MAALTTGREQWTKDGAETNTNAKPTSTITTSTSSQINIAETTKMLVDKLLNLERPQITEAMQPLLLTEESRTIFLSHLLSPPNHDEQAIKNSYWISKLISEDISGLKVLEQAYDELFITTLLHCFRPNTPCWIPHICVVFSSLLRGRSDQVTKVLTSSTTACLVHFTTLCGFSHIDLVSGLIQDIVCLPAPLPGHSAISCTSELQVLLNEKLAECDVWYLLSAMIINTDIPLSHSIAAADCLTSSLKRTSVSAHATPLATLLTASIERIIDQLIQFTHVHLVNSREDPVNNDTVIRFGLCVDTVLAFLEQTMSKTVEAASSAAYQSFGGTVMMRIPNMLHSAFPVALMKLIELRTKMFDLLKMTLTTNNSDATTLAVKHTGYITSVPFTLARLNLVRILHIMLSPQVEVDTQGISMITEVPDALWRLLGSWFCSYPHSNLYHHVYVQIFSFVLGSNCDQAIKGIVKRAKKKKKKSDLGMLSRCMRHYIDKDPNSSVRGHILTCLNIVRLHAQTSPPTSALNSYLRDLQEWREFLPILEEQTGMTIAAQKYEVPHKWNEVVQTDYGYELGSPYAVGLGFDKDIKKFQVEGEGEENKDEEVEEDTNSSDEFQVMD